MGARLSMRLSVVDADFLPRILAVYGQDIATYTAATQRLLRRQMDGGIPLGNAGFGKKL